MRKFLPALAALALLVLGLSWVAPASATPPGPQYVSASAVADSFNGVYRVTPLAQCPQGSKVLGGGYEMTPLPDPNGSITYNTVGIEDTFPDAAANGWRVVYDNSSSGAVVRVTAWAVCA